MAEKQLNRNPTARQIKAAKLISENLSADKPKPVGALLKEAGYSDNQAARPSDITQSVGFQKILEDAGVTDEKLSKVLDDGLSATDKNGQPDYSVRHKYLETGVKLKGHVSGTPDTPPPVQNNQFNFISSELVEDFTKHILEKTKMPVDDVSS